MKAKVVGAGSIGSHLSHALRQLGHGVVLCDIDPQALERTREQIYPGRYGRWDEDIELPLVHEAQWGGFDLVVIGTPPEGHVDLALDALDEDPRAILVEKPVCTPALEGVAALLTKAQARGWQLFVGYNHVVAAATTRVCDLIDSIDGAVVADSSRLAPTRRCETKGPFQEQASWISDTTGRVGIWNDVGHLLVYVGCDVFE